MARIPVKGPFRTALLSAALSLLANTAGLALDRLEFSVAGDDKALASDLRGVSVLLASQTAGKTLAQEVFTDARAEYGNLLGALYARGHYSAVIHVYIDGKEAAGIAPLNAPVAISAVRVEVDPGPAFVFSKAKVAPLAPRTKMPTGFAVGKVAESGVVLDAVAAGVEGWRAQGNAKARASAQDLVADHKRANLSADVTLAPGPKLRFGPLVVKGAERMRVDRIKAIAGLPEGKVFRPEDLDRAASRLRRTGVFKSVAIIEDDAITNPDLLGITATVIEEKLRRYSYGAEIASDTGLALNAMWMHRNLLGGGERLTVTGEVSNIGGNSGGADYRLGLDFSRPATFDADTTLGTSLSYGKTNETDYALDLFDVGARLDHVFSDSLTGSAGLGYSVAKVSGLGYAQSFRSLELPLGLTWDRRDSKTDPTRMYYLNAELKPFVGFGDTDSGARIKLDLRGYKSLGTEGRFVLAVRVQAGAIFGASLAGTPSDDLFFSGGGGTVRGQPYKSLGVNKLKMASGDTYQSGGQAFLGASLEGRMKVTDTIGVVGFVDVGRIDATSFFKDGDWHAGAGIGVRYATPVGPIRLDIAAPVGGDTGSGLKIYVGLGQAF